MYLASERRVVNGVGLGAVDGFDVGKMFTRMFKFTPNSFKMSNIMGAVGSVVSNFGTFGLASALAPKTFGAHSTTMKQVGMGVTAAAAAAGAYYGGSALMNTGIGQSVVGGAGNLLKSAGSFITNNASSILKTGMGLFTSPSGGGGGGGMTQAQYDAMVAQQQQAAMIAQQQAAYNAQQAQNAADKSVENQLTPTVYPTMDSGASIPGSAGPYPQDMQIQSPYSPLSDPTVSQYVDPTTGLVTDPATGNKLDPATGQVVQAGMLPQLSTNTWLLIGGATLLGIYLTAGSKSTN
jgi:type II secretory pathway pseudopilin PulG